MGTLVCGIVFFTATPVTLVVLLCMCIHDEPGGIPEGAVRYGIKMRVLAVALFVLCYGGLSVFLIVRLVTGSVSAVAFWAAGPQLFVLSILSIIGILEEFFCYKTYDDEGVTVKTALFKPKFYPYSRIAYYYVYRFNGCKYYFSDRDHISLFSQEMIAVGSEGLVNAIMAHGDLVMSDGPIGRRAPEYKTNPRYRHSVDWDNALAASFVFLLFALIMLIPLGIMLGMGAPEAAPALFYSFVGITALCACLAAAFLIKYFHIKKHAPPSEEE